VPTLAKIIGHTDPAFTLRTYAGHLLTDESPAALTDVL
jgi:hypothetical protein